MSHASLFQRVEISRVAPEPGLRVIYGRGSIVVPATTVPSVAGRRNEIAWSIVVEVELSAADGAPSSLRESFPVVITAGPA